MWSLSLWVGGTLCVSIAGLFNVLDKHIFGGDGVERRSVRGGEVKEKKCDNFFNRNEVSEHTSCKI